MSQLTDNFHRRIEYLRISVTDRCNLRCVYCMPEEGVVPLLHRDILSFEEILLVVRQAAALGVSRVRVTGGEPLVRKGLVGFIGELAKIEGIRDLALTTNGIYLDRYAGDLAAAGLKRVNISLDTLDPDRYRAITRGGSLTEALNGITAAYEAGLTPVKLNCVVMRGVNDDEIPAFAVLTQERAIHVRFIEYMPIGADPEVWANRFLPVVAIRERLAAIAPLEPAGPVAGSGPATYWRLPGAPGTLGLISPVSEHFCGECNRLRLTADGKLRPCLLADTEIDLRARLRSGRTDVTDLLLAAVGAKGERHHLGDGDGAAALKRRMAQIGG